MSNTSWTSLSMCVPGAPPEAALPLTRWNLPLSMSPASPCRGKVISDSIDQVLVRGSYASTARNVLCHGPFERSSPPATYILPLYVPHATALRAVGIGDLSGPH